MLRRITQLLSIIMGCSVVVLIGYVIYKYCHYSKYPDFYIVQSAPWYTGILLYGAITLIVLAACFLLKLLLKAIDLHIQKI